MRLWNAKRGGNQGKSGGTFPPSLWKRGVLLIMGMDRPSLEIHGWMEGRDSPLEIPSSRQRVKRFRASSRKPP